VNEPQFGGEGADGAGGAEASCCSGSPSPGGEVEAEADMRMALSSVLRYTTSFSGDVESVQLLLPLFALLSAEEHAELGTVVALAASCCSSART
jgi:hypothetical protein